MKTLDEYTIYCTEEQMTKALELGAKIEDDGSILSLPTAEQMIGWLEEKGVEVRPMKIRYRNNTSAYAFSMLDNDGFYLPYKDRDYPTRPEATLAAIDAALDYLIKNKK